MYKMKSVKENTACSVSKAEGDAISSQHIKTEEKTEEELFDHPSSDTDTNKTVHCSLKSIVPLYHTSNFSETNTKLENGIADKPINDCTEDNATQISDTIAHAVADIVENSKPFKCSECPYVGASKISVSVHTTKKHPKRKRTFKCTHCSFVSRYECYLQVHTKVHSREKPFKCPHCPHAVAQKSNLQGHIRTHTGERPFKCPDCPYAAAQKGTLNVHVMKHVVRNPFKCPHCSFGAVEVSSLNRHVKTHIGEY
uniref:Zf-H2C2_2 domain-containing protein n=1 Tax=Thalassocalyce inconstans TaxID=140487 RepID=V9PPZ1_THAIN|nr:zf-H2C2_2 domain-containing protein [Thalassocalyce inconstans]AHA51438.1 zf-H2C2_2 domain-containing protein [Thalassocalyce inconstans]